MVEKGNKQKSRRETQKHEQLSLKEKRKRKKEKRAAGETILNISKG